MPTYKELLKIKTKRRVIPSDTDAHTVFACWGIRSKRTFDYKNRRPLGFASQTKAYYAAYCAKRRLKKITKSLRKYASFNFCVSCHSITNECLSIKL